MTRHLCIGLNYEGTQNQLGGCENDAEGYHSALRASAKKSRGELLDGCSAATLRETLSALSAIQTPSDTFYLTFSGHGTTVASATEPDGKDECLVLWSEKTGFELVKDDDLRRWLEAIPGTVVCIFDSCFSGGMEREMKAPPCHSAKPRRMAAPYNLAPVSVAHAPGERVATRVYWLMACAEHEVSWDLGDNGLFSRSLFRVMADGSASKTTSAVMREVAKECRPDQTPRWVSVNGTGGRKVW